MAAPAEVREGEHLNDIPLQVEVELDRHFATIKEVLQLAVGTILTLNRAAGEPVEIRVGGSCIGVGEIIAFNENCGVRVSELNADS